MYQKPIRDVDQLKQRLVEVWSDMQQTVIDVAIGKWRKRLRPASVRRDIILNICFNFFMLSVVCKAYSFKHHSVNVRMFNS